MVRDSRIKKLIEIAYMYYIDGLSQNQISKKLSISRSNVSIMLSEARLKGIVQIRIKNSELFCFDLERKLEKLFRLKRAIVIPNWSKHIENQNILVQLAHATADYLNQIINDNMIISVSWGEILYELANRIEPNMKNNLLVTSLTGGIGKQINEFHSGFIAKILSTRFECSSLGLYTPNFLSTKEIKETICRDSNINEVINKSKNADVAIIEIKSINNSIMSSFDSLTKNNFNELIEKGAVGEFSTWFYDKNGNFINSEINERNIAVNYDSLKNIPNIIGVSGGIENTEAVHSALKGMFVDVLITDEVVAEKIIEEYHS